MIHTKAIKFLMWFFMYPLMAVYSRDVAFILVAGTMAGVFAFFITWAIQLGLKNRNLPVDRDKVMERRNRRSSDEFSLLPDDIDGSYGHGTAGGLD